MQRIRAWVQAHPDEAKDVRRANKAYVFFRVADLPRNAEPVGGEGVPLVPGRSIAVDHSLHVYGTPFFIAADLPIADGKAATKFRRLVFAQDTGSAIVGPARADIYFGAGAKAARIAGRIRNPGEFVMRCRARLIRQRRRATYRCRQQAANTMSRRRPLSEEERTLWRGFARSITPLRELQPKAAPPEPPAPPAGSDAGAPISSPSRGTAQGEVRLQKPPPPLAPLGRKLKQRVGRGREPIEDRLDLHGKTQREAHTALLRFLARAQRDGAKIVLVVTGKGTAKGSASDEDAARTERGVLRRQVPLWLALPEFRSFVVGFEDAHIFHGGGGALYVRLRRSHANDRE